jgi:deazaflavin-dependent oxidoreductase (nitroreductase family)
MTASSTSKQLKDRFTRLMTQLATPVHRFLYRVSNGAIGGRMFGEQVLLLTTTGRKSGQERTVPLLFLRDGERMILVASNGGQDRPPAWYLNLRDKAEATVEIGREKVAVRAEEAQGAERERLWELVAMRAPVYKQYQTATTRPIPLMILHRQGTR